MYLIFLHSFANEFQILGTIYQDYNSPLYFLLSTEEPVTISGQFRRPPAPTPAEQGPTPTYLWLLF